MLHCDIHDIDYEEMVICGRHVAIGCPKCQAENDAANADYMRKLAIYQANAREGDEHDKLLKMGVLPKYLDCTFDNFVTNTIETKTAKEQVMGLTQGKYQQILLIGSNGTGKTHLAVAAVKVMDGRIMTMFELGASIRATYSRNSEKTELEALDEMVSYPLFVIDEIGRSKNGDSDANWLSYIVDKRHSFFRPTMLISNKPPRSMSKSGEVCFEDFLGMDVMSRICEGGTIVMLNGKDWRSCDGK